MVYRETDLRGAAALGQTTVGRVTEGAADAAGARADEPEVLQPLSGTTVSQRGGLARAERGEPGLEPVPNGKSAPGAPSPRSYAGPGDFGSWCRYIVVVALLSLISLYNYRVQQRNHDLHQHFAEDFPVISPPTAEKLHVMVTGGAGFIGSHVALELLSRGHAVTVVDDLSRGNIGAIAVLRAMAAPRKFRFLRGDVVDASFMLQALTHPRVDLVAHCASLSLEAESMRDPLLYYQASAGNVLALLQHMRATGVRKLVYGSTAAVYGGTETLVPLSEHMPPEPASACGRAALLAEAAMTDFGGRNATFQATILRHFDVIGSDPRGRLGEFRSPDLASADTERAVAECLDAAQGRGDGAVVIRTGFATRDGTRLRDYVHVADLARAYAAAAQAAANPPAIFNVGSGKGVTVKEIVDMCQSITKGSGGARPVEVRMQQAEGAESALAANVLADTRLATAGLRWTPRHTDLEESMRHAWRWRQAHPNGYTDEDIRLAAGWAL